MNDLFSVKDKVIAITGAGGVLCSEMAKTLAARGAKIAVLDLNETAAQTVADAIHKSGGAAAAIKCNVLDKASVQQAHDAILAKFGRIDVLINGAGGNKKEATTSPEMCFFDMPADALRFVFELNFIGTLLPSQVFAKTMAGVGSGII